jgi:Protein of unknown function (DUF3048) N-terminal domain/Protein of unknown function (DUF3048) C-terminal domain
MSDDTPNEPLSGETPEPRVSRDAARAGNRSSTNRKIAAIVAVIAVVVLGAGAAVFAMGGDEDAAPTTTEKKATTTTEATTTTVPAPQGPIAPLTGVQLALDDAAGAALLNRPALVAKVDNAPEAMPQVGLQLADTVIELKVEGISRYMAVIHSKDAQEIGPVRSARTSDPDLLAMFVRPLVAWSGGNPTVSEIMGSTPWIQSLNHTQAEPAYSRTNTKKAPHNLMVNVPEIYTFADQPPAVPVPLFGYLAAGQDPGGQPVLGFGLHVGMSPLGYVFDPATGTWLRWSNDRRHVDENGNQIAPTNVVVLETPYVASGADSRSPEAQTLGSGGAWVFTQGRMIPGTWERNAPEQPWKLTGLDGQPILLTPGPTWVELPEPGAQPALLDDAGVAQFQAL